ASVQHKVQTHKSTSFVSVFSAVILTVVLVLICLAVVLIHYMFSHKGSYRTNEAKGTEFAETADAALRGDPTLRDAVDVSKKEYFI
uniref:Glycophorin C (Gerbich blood group) n=1 Tax=Sander lucioperca TaxID=283035 RepID=A0A8C9ZNK8_SANLU